MNYSMAISNFRDDPTRHISRTRTRILTLADSEEHFASGSSSRDPKEVLSLLRNRTSLAKAKSRYLGVECVRLEVRELGGCEYVT